MEPKEAILFFDRKGYMPSSKVQTIDDYLNECAAKDRLVESVRDRNNAIFCEIDAEVIEASRKARQMFRNRYNADTLPTITTSRKNVRKISSKNRPMASLIANRINPGFYSMAGTTAILEKDVKLTIPIIATNSRCANEYVCHETIHALREQVKECRSAQPIKRIATKMIEETMAYKANDLDGQNILASLSNLSASYALFEQALSVPLIAAMATGIAFLQDSCNNKFLPSYQHHQNTTITSIATTTIFALSMNSLYSYLAAKKAQNVLLKAQDEGFNPFYLFIRSNYDEYNAKSGIEEQIANKNGVRWDIIRNTLDIAQAKQSRSGR